MGLQTALMAASDCFKTALEPLIKEIRSGFTLVNQAHSATPLSSQPSKMRRVIHAKRLFSNVTKTQTPEDQSRLNNSNNSNKQHYNRSVNKELTNIPEPPSIITGTNASVSPTLLLMFVSCQWRIYTCRGPKRKNERGPY